MIKVLFAENNDVVRRAIVNVLKKQPDFEIVGEVENGAAALQLLQDGLQPDVLLTDFNMPLMNGLQLVEHVASLNLGLSAIILTMHINATFMEKAMMAGAKGYLLKNGDMDELINCIREVHKGRLVVGNEFK
jgi:DNA-binding NarL/FixJ family response regulator